MDNQVKSVSWIGNICEKFETFYSEVDGIVKKELQHAENQLLTAGTNVKQFCSEFMEEILPESILNSLQEKNSPFENDKSADHTSGVLDKEAEAGHANGLSDCDSSIPPTMETMETAEEAHTIPAFTFKANDVKEMSFEENRVKETNYLPDILKFKGHSDGEFHSLDNLPNPFEVGHQSANCLEAGETSDLDPGDGESKLSTAYDLAASIVSADSEECQLLEDKVSSSDHTLLKELHEDGLDCHKAVAMKDLHIGIEGFMCEPNKVKIGDSCVMVDNSECFLTSGCPNQHPPNQRTVCKTCLTMKLEKQCKCEKSAGSKDCNAEFDQPVGELSSKPLLSGDSESCESDWVIV